MLSVVLALAWSAPTLAQDADTGSVAARGAQAPSADRAPAPSTARLGSGISIPGLGDLPAGKALTIVFRTSVDAGPFAAGKDDLANQGTVSGGNIPATLTDDPAFPGAADPTLTPLDAAPDLQLTAGDGGISTTPGATVAYSLGYANAGSQGATGVVLTATVPTHTTFNAGASTAGWSCANGAPGGSVCTLNIGALASPGSGSATFSVTVVNPVAAGVTQITVGASIADDNANGPDSVPANNVAGDTTPLTAQPDISLGKSDGGASVAPGGTVTYALTYSNVGDQGATGVVLTETVPANTTFNPGASTAGWTCVPDNNAGSTCTLAIAGELAGGGASGSANFAVTVVDPVPAGVTQISNTASAADDGTNGPDPNGGNNNGSDTTPINAAPDLSVSKDDGGASVAPGGTVAYSLAYANSGNRGATGVVLTETVPANTTFNPGASTAGWTCVPDNNAGSACTFTVGAVPAAGAGSSGTVTFAVTVVNPVAAGVAQISNTGSVADDGTNGSDSNPGNNTDTDTTPVDAAPDIALGKSDGGASVAPGGTVAYTLSYSNVGNQGGTGVTLTETVPANTTFNPGASTAGWSCVPDNNAGSTCTLAIGGLNGGGASGSATFAVTVVNPAPAGVTQISNSASAADDGANGTDPNTGNNTGSDTTPLDAAPDLVLNKDDKNATAVPGGTITYSLTYTNGGNQGATGVTLSETVPANTTFNAGGSTAGWSCADGSPAGTPCTLTVAGTLAGGGGAGGATFAVTVVNPLPAGVDQITNSGSVADDGSNGPDPNPGDNSDSESTPVTAAPDLTLTKSDGGATVNTGGTVTYTLSYANAGNQGATGVVLNETVPVHTTFNAGASTAGWSCADGSPAGTPCVLTIGGLNGGGANGSAAFAVTVASSVPAGVDQISNTADVDDDGGNGPDPTPGDNQSTDTTPLVAVPDLTASKTDNRIAVHGGQVITYVVTYNNVGSQGATGVTLLEAVPNDTTFFDPSGTSGWSCAHGAPAGTNCNFDVGALPSGGAAQSVDFRVKVVQHTPVGTVISNMVEIADDESNGPDGDPKNNTGLDTSTIVTPKGDMNRTAANPLDGDALFETRIARTDLVFQNEFSNRVVIWFMDYNAGSGQATQGGGLFTTPLAADAGYRVVGAADFARIGAQADTDGLTDLLLRHTTNGDLQLWMMNGTLRGELLPVVPVAAFPSLGFDVGATEDMDDDGRADIVWFNKNSGTVVIWKMDGRNQVLAGTGTTNPATLPSNAWKVVGAGDFNGDRHNDLLLQDGTTGEVRLWLMDGARNVTSSVTVGTRPATEAVVAVGDYDADEDPDIVLRDTVSGVMSTWFMNGTAPAAAPSANNPSVVPGTLPQALSWRLVGPR
jgi:uncharacterized repeat protein (TIGR01451 family)